MKKPIKRQPVESSNIRSIGYDAISKTLEIEFRKGVYQYSPITQDIYEELMDAESIGKYFIAHIRESNYTVKKIS